MNTNKPDNTLTEDEEKSPSRLRSFLKKLGFKGGGDHTLRESLEEVIEEHEDTATEQTLGDEEREMLLNVLKYNELRADDIMVPRADIVAVEISTSFKDLVQTLCQAGHSRLPIYRKTLDDVVGMIHVKDALGVLGGDGKSPGPAIKEIMREVIVVPPSMRLIDLLKRMKSQRIHMALVVDEFGGTDGLVTIEDLVEQIVGEIEDEYDSEDEPGLTFIGSGIYEADARLSVEELEETLQHDLLSDERDEDVDTVGGLVFALEGRVPEIGESIDHPLGFRFEIIDASPRAIKKVRIHLPRSNGGAETD